jgi:DNA invertase Pin-like site-specific DNA recombinase
LPKSLVQDLELGHLRVLEDLYKLTEAWHDADNSVPGRKDSNAMPQSKPSALRAFSYIRFSSPKQAAGGSLARQTEWTEAYCKRKGLVLDDTLSLNDLGVSAFRGDNVRDGALAGFLEACRMGRVPRGSVFVVESLDRLSRDQIRPALQLFLALQDFGITIVTLQPEREYLPDGTDALSLIEPLIIFARGHEESLMKSHRRREAWKAAYNNARQTNGNIIKTCPAWLEHHEDGFRIRHKAAAIVSRIFDLAIEGMGVYSITRVLNHEGLPTIGTSKHKKWVRSYVHRILTSPAAVGTYQPHKQDGKTFVAEGPPIPNYFPAIITQERWDDAQRAIEQRGNGKGAGRKGMAETNLFGELLCDASTGERPLVHYNVAKNARGDRKKYRYLLFPPSGPESRLARRVSYDIVEEGVLSLFGELSPADLISDGGHADDRRAEIAALSAQVLDIDSKLERARQRATSTADFDGLLDLIQHLQAERKATIDRRAELEHADDGQTPAALGEAQSLITLLASASDSDRAELRRKLKRHLKMLVERIYILLVRRGGVSLIAIQAFFRGSTRRRSFLIVSKSGTKHGPGWWSACSLRRDIAPDDLDLRHNRQMKDLTKALQKIDIGLLAAAMTKES